MRSESTYAHTYALFYKKKCRAYIAYSEIPASSKILYMGTHKKNIIFHPHFRSLKYWQEKLFSLT